MNMKKSYLHQLSENLTTWLITILLLWSASTTVFAQSAKGQLPDSNQFSVPSWTLYKRALIANIEIEKARQLLDSKSTPYDVIMNINGNPATRMGFNWFTNQEITDEILKIITGSASDLSAFTKPLFTINATSEPVNNIIYCNASNNLSTLAGTVNNIKKSFTSHKALATGLKPNTTYSFIVGKPGAWSKIGSFTTAGTNKEIFSFNYFTDPQANTYEMFDISQKTTHAALSMYPNANFFLTCGDLVQSSGTNNSEWEYEQFFATQQDIFYQKPLTPIIGNHDFTPNKNFSYHFNTNNPSFDKKLATVPGSVYSFVYGDALFMALEYEDYNVPGYLDSLSLWMKKEVAAHPDTKWRIAFYHKTLYTGSNSHQSDDDGRLIREKMGPVYDELKIDLALQGHDHIYEVIGPIKNKVVVANAVSNQTIVPKTVRDNVTGRLGGTFDVTNGTLFFLNNSSGKKKYEPRDSIAMEKEKATTGISDYFTYFTGRFGQSGEPTFSNISVSTDAIKVNTYTVNDGGLATLFDSFNIVKTVPGKTSVKKN
jgi:acid phosphatase type 7